MLKILTTNFFSLIKVKPRICVEIKCEQNAQLLCITAQRVKYTLQSFDNSETLLNMQA